MFDTTKLQNCLKNILGWKNHYDENEIPALNAELNESESGEFYQDYHPALRLDLISTSLPENRELNEYLNEKIQVGITQLGNQIFTEKKLTEFSKELLANGTIINGHGWANDVILNESRFVGLKIKTNSDIGFKAIINRLGFQFTQAQNDLKIYIYHSTKVDPVKTITLNSTQGMQWAWINDSIDLSFENDDMSEGYWIVGYYQDDISGQALQYKKLNWRTGFCGSCNGGIDLHRWNTIKKYVSIQPIYVPSASLDTDRKMFDLESSFSVYDNNFGINLNISAKCDLTSFLCDNKMLLKNALGLKVTHLILRDIKFSQQINRIEESLKHLIIRDLEGDKDTNYVNIVTQLSRAVKAVNIDTDNLSKACLPCTKKNRVKYGVA
ncbi:hypothetical protein PL373_13595 [Tenacibaculum maritimum]|nr:hypothetical protein [Tenacibaculum maritimum]MDB0602163.1 hypothetical protein [Tenacibaculum maritimum]MDB0613839.1 hypothetical protein [Tenacibaculum maritimum]